MFENDLKKLTDTFTAYIHSSKRTIGNETYIDADPQHILEICTFINNKMGYSLVSMFAVDERALAAGKFAIYYTFADRTEGKLLTVKTLHGEGNLSFHSICSTVHAAALYEREIRDMFGLTPVDHPDPRRLVFHSNWPEGRFPLRKDFDGGSRPERAKVEMQFKRVEGDGVYEIPVGPVHAGIIEPGHFRFSVAGEPIINLEAQLYFVHKGIEKMSEGMTIEKCLFISERISGDETIANSLAFCQAVEKMAGIEVPARARYIRVIFAELERLTSHLGDLAGICLDTAYGFAAFQFRMLRGWSYQIADRLCGMRFLRNVNKPGGVRKEFIAGKESEILELLGRIRAELKDTADIINANSLFIDRVENTGVLSTEAAQDLNVVGPAGRASGVRHDVRRTFPYAAYGELDFSVPEHNNGDVNCRMNVKIEECLESIDLIVKAINSIPEGKISEAFPDITPYSSAYGMTEAPRGENVHWVMMGEAGRIFRYKIRTPSFCNWPAVCLAVRGNIVPDFPLINKSFNLSYAGNDL